MKRQTNHRRIIFVNAIKSNSGGGRSILVSIIETLSHNSTYDDNFVFLVKNKEEFKKYEGENIVFLSLPPHCNTAILYPIINKYVLPRFIAAHGADLIFNLADLPIPSSIPQLMYYDWPYALYPDSAAWKRMNLFEFTKRKVKSHFFAKYCDYPKMYIAQTNVVKRRLSEYFGIQNVVVIPNAVSFSKEGRYLTDNVIPDKLEGTYYLLCLTYYYSHKNIDILLEVAKRIKSQGLPYRIVITIEKHQGKGAKNILSLIEKFGLNEILVNVGYLNEMQVKKIYSEVDAIILPTLLETFSGTYVEAMHYGKPIFTSDIDFSRDVCSDAAIYFDPFSADDILTKLTHSFENKAVLQEVINNGHVQLAGYRGWEDVFPQIYAEFDSLLYSGTSENAN